MSWNIKVVGSPQLVASEIADNEHVDDGVKYIVSKICSGVFLGNNQHLLIETQGHFEACGGAMSLTYSTVKIAGTGSATPNTGIPEGLQHCPRCGWNHKPDDSCVPISNKECRG